jgi:CBS domain containing-hemolysin-like protein
VSDGKLLLWLMVVPTFFIAVCSASELSLLTADKKEANNMQRLQTANYSKPGLLKRAVSAMLKRLSTDETFTNAIIVMANTIFAISMTVGIGHCLNKVDAADAFTIFGITIVLFLAGETIPKQVALRLRGPSRKMALVWLYILSLTLVVPFLCAGIVDTFEWIPRND